ncbi:MAG: hypothetical protein RL612_48, partial [Actinomycetota bacterium]
MSDEIKNEEVVEETVEVAETETAEDSKDSIKALEEEGDIAADYLEELLDIYD